MASTVILIPARLQATRLPNKPLALIAGEPMIVHVWRRACAAEAGRVVVATDADEIRDAVRKAGGEAVMTRADHVSGSDRIYEALNHIDPEGDADYVVNLQGDLPTLEPRLVTATLKPLLAKGPDIATIAAEITTAEDRDNPNVVKAQPHPLAKAHSITTSEFMPTDGRRSNGSCRFAHHPWNCANGLSSCARLKMECALMSRLLRRSP
jgi:3-deoxy-manno-octulosonate cytidylyltransferase (CMP-KDO synthetase)